MKSAFIYRRDLRVMDNAGLIRACKESDEVLPLFILDPRQTGENPYKSEFAPAFMIESLKYLYKEASGKSILEN